jgi:hypothetical protein
VKKIIYFLMVSCAVLALQVATVAAQAPVNIAPPTGAPGGPPGAPVAEPDLDAMSDAELEAMFAEAPEDDAPVAPGGPNGTPPGAPPMGAPPMGAPPFGAPPAR